MVAKVIAAAMALVGLPFFIFYEVVVVVAEILALPFVVLWLMFCELVRSK